jgi:hypothetical protein
MANLWLRLYHDMPNDPKWRTIARVSQQPIPLVLAVYLHLLVIASQATDRGAVGVINAEDLSSALDADSVAITAILTAMQGRVIQDARLSGWDKRQVVREDSSTERVKRYREQCNAVKRNVTLDKSREEEIRTEESTKTLASTAIAVTADKGKLIGKLPLNDNTDWEIYQADIDLLQPLYPAVDVRQELRSMKGWLIGNPTLRKTRRGIKRFITSWLEKEQDKAKPGANHGTNAKFTESQASTERVLADIRAGIRSAEVSGGRVIEAGTSL